METQLRHVFEPRAQPFPIVNNSTAPNPPSFFADDMQKQLLPTNSAWKNYVLKRGSQVEYIHPYLVQSKQGSLTICYPSRAVEPGFIYQVFVANLLISCSPSGSRVISKFDDLSVTLVLPGPFTVPLIRGSPYITDIVKGGDLQFSTIHAVLNVSSHDHDTKHKIVFNNGQTWLIYSANSLFLNKDLNVSRSYQGILRISILSDKDGEVADAKEKILDQFSTTYLVGECINLQTPFRVTYQWKKKGWGELLMLCHLVHRQILASPASDMVITQLNYSSMDGELLGIVVDSWVLEETPIIVYWYSIKGFQNQEAIDHVNAALEQDVANLQPTKTSSTYFYGKHLARAARFALIAKEAHYQDVIPRVREFLEEFITPWLDGSFEGNAFLYDNKWGGLISRNGAQDSGVDFGLGVYNDHHFHFGYFCYAIAILAKLNRNWALKFKPQFYAIVNDFMTMNPHKQVLYPRLRNFDLWKLHSWPSGITEFANGRNQESTSEAVNAYYSAALLGLAYGDTHLIATGSTITALEMRTAKALWHVPLNNMFYESAFVEENRVVGVQWKTSGTVDCGSHMLLRENAD